MQIDNDVVFADTYAEARKSFRLLSERSGAECRAHQLPSAVGFNGEPLFVDTAYFGPKSATKALLSISGTHGQEFQAGSAAQRHWIRSEQWRDLPDDVAVLFVHTLNPYGCSHFSRSNENNVDLNRNFIDHGKPHPKNPLYGEVAELLKVGEPTDEMFEVFNQRLSALEERHGLEQFRRSVMQGQYEHPEASGYGGVQPEWSNILLREIVSSDLSDARSIGYVDWHTGIGPEDDIYVVCFNHPDESEYAYLCDWWGKDRISSSLSSFGDFDFRPDFSGVTYYGARQSAPNAQVIGAIVEFGTYPQDDMMRAGIADIWLRFYCDDPRGPQAEKWRAFMMERFWPSATEWRENCLRLGDDLHRRTIDGLSRLP